MKKLDLFIFKTLFTFLLPYSIFIVSCSSEEEDAIVPNSDSILPTNVEASTQELKGTILFDTTLVDIFSDPLVPDYRITGSLKVTAELNIEPGVTIEILDSLHISVWPTGAIIAEGNEQQHIVFRGTDSGTWTGMIIDGNTFDGTGIAPQLNKFVYVDFMNSGIDSEEQFFDWMDDFDASTIGLDDEAKVLFDHCTFSEGNGYGIQTISGESEITITNSNFYDHELGALYIHPSHIQNIDHSNNFHDGAVAINSGSTYVDSTEVWPKLNNGVYHILRDVLISNEVTIEPGATFEFGPDAWLQVMNEGKLIAIGTESDSITFTGIKKEPGSWHRILFANTNGKTNELSHCIMEYGGAYSSYCNVEIIYSSQVSIANSRISDSDGWGIRTQGEYFTFEENNNTYSNNRLGKIENY
jgi:hypothetical protein